jgi:hypothetical protein
MPLDDLLKELGPRIGMPALALDADGLCAISFGDGATITIALDGETGCVLLGYCGGLPGQRRVPYLRQLLEANFFRRGTGGAVIALETDLDEALLVQRLPLAGLDSTSLETTLTAFAAYQERWSMRAAEALEAA